MAVHFKNCTAWSLSRCGTSTCSARGKIPASAYSGVLSLFNAALLEGKQPTVYGDGEQSRDFVYVENVVAANLLAAEAKGAPGLAINVAREIAAH